MMILSEQGLLCRTLSQGARPHLLPPESLQLLSKPVFLVSCDDPLHPCAMKTWPCSQGLPPAQELAPVPQLCGKDQKQGKAENR